MMLEKWKFPVGVVADGGKVNASVLWMDGWMDGWMIDGWMDGWMDDRWMDDRWMDG